MRRTRRWTGESAYNVPKSRLKVQKRAFRGRGHGSAQANRRGGKECFAPCFAFDEPLHSPLRTPDGLTRTYIVESPLI